MKHENFKTCLKTENEKTTRIGTTKTKDNSIRETSERLFKHAGMPVRKADMLYWVNLRDEALNNSQPKPLRRKNRLLINTM